jgi:hypothetical protein
MARVQGKVACAFAVGAARGQGRSHAIQPSVPHLPDPMYKIFRPDPDKPVQGPATTGVVGKQ